MEFIWLWPLLVIFLLSSLVAASMRRNRRAKFEAEQKKLQELANLADSKICPSCAEKIKAEANVCKHCGSDVSTVTTTSDASHAQHVMEAQAVLEKERRKEYHAKRLPLYLLPFGLIGLAVLIYFFGFVF